MKLMLRSLLLLVCAFAASCSSGHIGAEFARRDGPPFAEAFPDMSVLVTTDEVRDTRALLSTVPLPDTKEHHEALLALLERTQELDTEHLLLLTEAVALDLDSISHTTVFTNGKGLTVHWGRGTGEPARVIDELLLNGVTKLRDPSPQHLGKLLGKTQAKETIVALADRCTGMDNALDWDDGSDSDLEIILKEAPSDQIRNEYCIEVLLPDGRLDESRTDVALRILSFDSGRKQLIAADYGQRHTLSTSTMLEHAKLMSFDSGRISVIEYGAPLLSTIHGAEALEIVRLASFDSGRAEIIQLLAKGSLTQLGGDELLDFMQTASFDSGRLEIMTALQPHMDSTLSSEELLDLLTTSSFDSGRIQIAEVLASELKRIPISERDPILNCFSFDSGKSELRELLGW